MENLSNLFSVFQNLCKSEMSFLNQQGLPCMVKLKDKNTFSYGGKTIWLYAFIEVCTLCIIDAGALYVLLLMQI